MCGIFGYIGPREVLPVLIDGLEMLEYRGYDSAGVAVQHKNAIKGVKCEGKLASLKSLLKGKKLPGTAGIAHTRWATHGAVNDTNAHPHYDSESMIWIVHNGIIENAPELRTMLEENGTVLRSDTDSEVIAHLLEYFAGDSLEHSMLNIMPMLEGTFAIAAIKSDEKKIVAARRGSPLVIGLGDREFFVSSDTTPLLRYTKKVNYLGENQIAVLDEKGCRLMNNAGKKITMQVKVLTDNVEDVELGEFKTYMHKEIHEQPRVMMENLKKIESGKVELDLKLSKEYLESLRRIVITACGTSWHAALIGKQVIESCLQIPVEVDYASEFRYRNPLIAKDDLVIGISQSGETADTLAALREAKKRGAQIMGIVNTPGSTVAREVDHLMLIGAGKEIGVASTKAFTGQVLALNLLNLFMDQQLERMSKDDREAILSEMKKLPAKIEQALTQEDFVKEMASHYDEGKKLKNALFMGRGVNFPTALEGALKLKEISYIHAEGYPAAEMKHGPIALIDEKMPSIFIINQDGDLYYKILSNMEEVKARGGHIMAVADKVDDQLKKLADHIIKVPSTHAFLSPIVNVISLQLFSFHVANSRDLDVDKPRNLAKSVTVE